MVNEYVNLENMRSIIFYRTESGICPVEESLDSLAGKQAKKVTWVLRLIQELDVIPKQYFKKLTNTDDIWEVRIQFGNNIFRILGFFNESKLIILNHAFVKKSQKTPKNDIKIAEQRKTDYLRRKINE